MFHREPDYGPDIPARLPADYAVPDFATHGGVLCYGVALVEQYRQAAGYVDRILRGAKLGDLPVQVLTKFELIINLKTAKALGLSVSSADEAIE